MAGRRPPAALSSAQIRSAFTNYFVGTGHTPVRSSSLVPEGDPTLLFTNAGMVQFKDYFLGRREPPFQSAVSVQNCMRAGGKHNDLDNVGFTPRHHTLFEMLGNFSFGSYFKERAITQAWDFLTKSLQLPPERLRVTVLEGDEETHALWRKYAGLPADRVLYSGPDDNFWSMGFGEGPCGPCTEIYWDLQDLAPNPDDRWLEIWNLVFMQYNRGPDGTLTPLERPCVDTGMGLERVASVVQGKASNYEIDTFQTLTQGVLRLVPESRRDAAARSPEVRIIADHARACVHLIADGVLPSNTGRAYVLRRILRRAVNAGHQLGIEDHFMRKLVPVVIEAASLENRPSLLAKEQAIAAVLDKEEVLFRENLQRGRGLMEETVRAHGCVRAEDAFKLYDTFGFPLDLVGIVARSHGWRADLEGAERLLEGQRERSRQAFLSGGGLSGSGSAAARQKEEAFGAWKAAGLRTTFTGYADKIGEQAAAVQALHVIDKDDPSQGAWLCLDTTPFYARGGGQVGDTGFIRTASGERFAVRDTVRPYEGAIALHIVPDEGATAAAAVDWTALQPGEPVTCHVDMARRRRIRAHHTATHLLGAALRRELGANVAQAGSHVDAGRLRLDFTHGAKMTPEQLARVQADVSAVIEAADNVESLEMPLQQALDAGATALFSEKYGERVRCVRVGDFSFELCGGTHAVNVAELNPFIILGETAVASGVRRIEAVAGPAALELLREEHDILHEACQQLKTTPRDLVKRIGSTVTARRDAANQLQRVLGELAAAPTLGHSLVGMRTGGMPVQLHLLPSIFTPDFLRQRALALRTMSPTRAHIVVAGRNIVSAADTATFPDLHVGKMVTELAALLGGNGGGQRDLGTAVVGEAYAAGPHGFHPTLLQWAHLLPADAAAAAGRPASTPSTMAAASKA